MKPILTGLIAGLLLSTFPVQAQEQNGCFMLDEKGNSVNLGNLCGVGGGNNTSPPSQNSSTPGVFNVPIKRRISGIPVIDVTFNKQHKFEMMLDTGASKTVLTPTMAQVLQIRPQGVMRASTVGGEIVAPIGYVNSVEVAGLSTQQFIVAVVDMEIGLLGQDFYSEYDVIIRKNVIEFHHR